jgi:cell division protein FtsZ
LRQGIQGISELITIPGLINLDFNDVRAIMSEGGAALMAVGRASGEGRARAASEAAISSNLLDVTIDGARGILFNVTGGPDMSLFEVNEAAAIIKETAHPDVNLIFGAVIDENMGDEVRITVIATGFEQDRAMRRPSASQASASNNWSSRPYQQQPAQQSYQQQQPPPPQQFQQPTSPAAPSFPASPPSQPPPENTSSVPQQQAPVQQPAPPPQQQPPSAPPTSSDDYNPIRTRGYDSDNADDLDIPAFLRRG